jgi:hypothetical protein
MQQDILVVTIHTGIQFQIKRLEYDFYNALLHLSLLPSQVTVFPSGLYALE